SLRVADSAEIRGLMNAATAGRLVIATASLHHAALAVHVFGPHPVRERVVRAVLVAPFWRRIEISVDAEEFLAAAPIRGIRMEDLAGLVSDEDAVARQVLEPGVHVFVVVG